MPTHLRVAFCSVDPRGLTPFDAFDPDSFSVMSAIADALVYVDSDGMLRPALATRWERVSPVALELELRRGVRFHDGSVLDAEDVVATFEAHREPTPSACGGGILSPIVRVIAVDEHRVRIETAFPDGMLLRRLFFGQIYPKGILRSRGRDAIVECPIATGAYRFVRWDRGREIVLERNPEHWAGTATVDRLHLSIVRQKEWIDRLVRGEIDVALNVDSHDAVRAKRTGKLVVESRPSSNAHAFLLRNGGPLADVRVRRALNHALHRRILVDLTEHGFGLPQRSVSSSVEEGYVECPPYRYSPELARRLLAEAGYAEGFTLRGLVSETSTALFFGCREFLARIGVRLEAEIVPIGEWMTSVVGGNLSGRPYDGDFAVTSMGNPLGHALFLQFANVFSRGPGSLTRDPEYDARFLQAATVVDPAEAPAAVAELERYAVDRALMLFTVQQHAHYVTRPGCSVTVPQSGMPTSETFWSLKAGEVTAERAPTHRPQATRDASLLLDGTSHTGTFYLRPEVAFDDPVTARIWKNILVSEERWQLQSEPMIREVVSLVDARNNLANVLGSTDRVAIVGYTDEGRELFRNRGYLAMLGEDPRPVTERLPHSGERSWSVIRAEVDRVGSWLGPVEIDVAGRHRSLYLTVAPALDDERVRIGYTFVLSDFSGEEERIRNRAIRTILDNVPYALFACDRDGRVLPGYSAAALTFFQGATVEGEELVRLLGLGRREAEHFLSCYQQIFDDILPPEVSLAQLPERLHVGPRVCGLSGAVMRSADGQVSGVLFTLLDVTELSKAEEEAERLRGTVQVLRYRSSFEAFVRDLDAQLHGFERRLELGEDVEADLRRALHTAKGVFGQFSLGDLMRFVHALEDNPHVSLDDVRALRGNVRRMLAAHASVWDIQIDGGGGKVTVPDAVLLDLNERVARAESLEQARALLEEGIDNLRRRPIAELLGPIAESAMVQAARLGKRVRVELEGLELRAPLRLAPVFGALGHLVRNAVDHGLEHPAERGAKPEHGVLLVRAVRDRDAVVVEVKDDGRGIDTRRLLERAVAFGAVTEEQAARIAGGGTSEGAFGLLFVEGLTTAAVVTETSGRGMGMIAVRDAVHAAGGSMRIDSRPGEGTRVEVRLPLGTATSPSLVPSKAPTSMAAKRAWSA